MDVGNAQCMLKLERFSKSTKSFIAKNSTIALFVQFWMISSILGEFVVLTYCHKDKTRKDHFRFFLCIIDNKFVSLAKKRMFLLSLDHVERLKIGADELFFITSTDRF